MRRPRSLQGRLGLWLGVTLTLVWITAATVTAILARREMEEVFDAALQETAQRILPLAVVDILGREDDGVTQHLAAIRDHDEYFTYIVRDRQGRILLQSHGADPAVFPAWDGTGFRLSDTHRFYNDEAVQGTIRITVAEPLDQRSKVARELQMGLGLPLLFNMVRSGKSPYLSLKEVYELGFDYAICPVEPMLAMHKAVKEMMETFLREGCTTNAIADRLTPFEEFNDFIGLPETAERAKRFGV